MDNNDIFGGFSAIAADLSGRTDKDDAPSLEDGPIGNDPIVEPPVDDNDPRNIKDDIDDNDVDDNDELDDEDELTEEEKKAIADKKKKKKKTPKKVETTEEDEDEDEDDEDEDDEPNNNTNPNPDDSLGTYESDIAEYVQAHIFEEFDIPMDEETKKFESINDIVDFVRAGIKEGSVPEFASDEVANIDSYVRNGGDLHAYMSNVYGSIDLETLDIDNPEVQKAIIREDLLNRGMSESRVNKRIERMEDTDILQDEAEDSLESLKEFRTKQEEKLLKDQEKAALAAEQANLEFVQSVETELEAIDNVLGHPISKAEKTKLYNYMLKPTAQGIPQYHIDYRNNRKHMIESAYFTMMGDKLTKKNVKKATTAATKRLKNKLADKPRGINQSTNHSGSVDSWSSVFKALR